MFGYPISEEFAEVNPTDGNTYSVQYFERNRFEWHPGARPQFNVQLGCSVLSMPATPRSIR